MTEKTADLWGYTFQYKAKAKGIMERREELSLCSITFSLLYLPSVYVSAMIMMEFSEGKDRECWKFLHKWNDEL
jgi:hypothetical protein